MASAKQYYLASLPLVFACVLCFAACTESRTSRNGQNKPAVADDQGTWCVANPSADEEKLGHNIDYSCAQSGVDCSLIKPQGSCYYPNNIVSHASVVMNLHYVAAGKHAWDCYFNGTALIVSVNPSIGQCMYAA